MITTIQLEIVRKDLVSANVKKLLLRRIVIGAVKDSMDTPTANLATVSSKEHEIDNAKTTEDSALASKILGENYVTNVVMVFTTSQNANVIIFSFIY